MREWWAKLRRVVSGRRELYDDLREEMNSHLQFEIEENLGRGMTPEEASTAARRRFGNTTQIAETAREAWRFRWLEILAQDVRYTFRMLWKNPIFTAVAVLSLTLGIGVNTAMFSVINVVLLRSLPYPEPAQLMRVGPRAVTIPEYEFWKEHSRVFSSITAYRGGGERQFVSGADQEWISTITVTTDFLRTLGVNPALGREFNSEETIPNGPQAIILSDSLWRRSFGADPQVLGRAVTLDGASFTVAGVLPSDFWFPQSTDALVPLRPSGSLSDTGTNTQLIARLKDGITIRQAQAEMATNSENFRRDHAGDASVPANYQGLMVMPYQDWLLGDVGLNLLLLFGASGLLLLISCSNLASLLLTRFAARGKELGVRVALGSSRRRLLAQFLTENLVVTALGASAGLAAAYGLLTALVGWMPFNLPASTPIRLDGAVLAFTLAVTAATALAFTLAPLLTVRRLNVQESLKSAGRTGGGDRVRTGTRNVLVIAEVALSTTLLIAAGLLIQSLYRMHQERLGFRPEGLITFQTPLAPERQRSPTDRLNFTRVMLERLQALPGVESVAATNVLPLTGWSNLPTQRDGHPEQSIGGMEIRPVTPSYFELMGIPVHRGRSFTGNDSGGSLPVAVVNETLARAWWPQNDPIGDRVVIGRFQGRELLQDLPREVIGIVGDTKTSLKEPPRPTVFVPMAQAEAFPPSSLVWTVRSSGYAGLAEGLRRVVADIDSGQRIRQLRTMDDIVTSSTADSRFNAWLFGIFAGAALVLAAIGVYGLLSFVVGQRRQEIGMRMALGATRFNVLRLFMKQGLALTTIGLGLGLGGALLLTRWLSSFLFGVEANDPLNFVAVSLLLLFIGLTATYLPARRAANINPMAALREE